MRTNRGKTGLSGYPDRGEIYSGQTTGGEERQSHTAGREALCLLAESRAEEKHAVDCLQHPLRSRYR
jgi:hypothetical protein